MALFRDLAAKLKKGESQPESKPQPAPRLSPLVTAPKPSPDFDPIPLYEGGDDDFLRGDPDDEIPKSSGRVVPVYTKLTVYFEEFRGREIPPADADELVQWYREYRRVHAGARVGVAALFGMARLLVRRKENDLALDAYERLLAVIDSTKRGQVALEAARFAEHIGAGDKAGELVAIALAESLPDQHRTLAEELSARLTSQ